MKFAICNELFTDPKAVGEEPWSFARQCDFAAEVGYDGLEVAPFTLGEKPTQIAISERDALRAEADRTGIPIIGLHWLLAKTEGLHLTTADKATRQRTGQYLGELANLCADLGGGLMVLGSPLQRNIEAGLSYEEAENHAVEVIEIATKIFEQRDVILCLEPLGETETNFMLTCDSARRIIDRIGSRCVQLHQDVKAMSHEQTPIPELIEQFADVTCHFHANDVNLRGPGMGDIDFAPIFTALFESKYAGYVSVEVFDYAPGAEATARESLAYMRAVWEKVST